MSLIGIIGAMESEVAELKNLMSETDIREKAGMKFYRGVLEGKPADTVAQLMKQHKNDDPRQKLEKEKNRLEKTITALQQRLQYVEESLENL